MPTEIILPRVDMDMASGKIAKWYAKDGDAIEKGALLFDLETSKAAMEIEAPASGVLRVSNPAIGEDIPVGQVLGWIYAPGEAYANDALAAAAAKPAASSAAPSPSAKADSPSASPTNGVRATPLARRLARERGVELASLTGSGPNGRIGRADLEIAAPVRSVSKTSSVAPIPAAALAALPPGPSDEKVFSLYEPGAYDLVPHDNMRRTIASRLVESKVTVPHFYLTVDCNLEKLLAAREELNARAPRDGQGVYKLSVNDFAIKALVLALRDNPLANATWSSAAMMRHKRVDLGVAVAVDGGLLTPVLRHADLKSLSELSNEMKTLAARARAKILAPSDHHGGCLRRLAGRHGRCGNCFTAYRLLHAVH